MWGTDQSSSLEIHAMDLLRKRILDVNKILGSKDKYITESEKPVLKNFTWIIYSTVKIKFVQ